MRGECCTVLLLDTRRKFLTIVDILYTYICVGKYICYVLESFNCALCVENSIVAENYWLLNCDREKGSEAADTGFHAGLRKFVVTGISE